MKIEKEDIPILNSILEYVFNKGNGYDLKWDLEDYINSDPELTEDFIDNGAKYSRLFQILRDHKIFIYEELYGRVGEVVKTETARLYLKNNEFQKLYDRNIEVDELLRIESEKIRNEAKLTARKLKWFPLTVIIAIVSAIITIIGLFLK